MGKIILRLLHKPAFGAAAETLDSLTAISGDMPRMSPTGSLCWQVGNFVDNGQIIPLDIQFDPILRRHGLALRNRIIWQFGHGLHNKHRFSGRYEVVLWYTRSDD